MTKTNTTLTADQDALMLGFVHHLLAEGKSEATAYIYSRCVRQTLALLADNNPRHFLPASVQAVSGSAMNAWRTYCALVQRQAATPGIADAIRAAAATPATHANAMMSPREIWACHQLLLRWLRPAVEVPQNRIERLKGTKSVRARCKELLLEPNGVGLLAGLDWRKYTLVDSFVHLDFFYLPPISVKQIETPLQILWNYGGWEPADPSTLNLPRPFCPMCPGSDVARPPRELRMILSAYTFHEESPMPDE